MMLRERLERTARFRNETRKFFSEKGFIEVDTPALCPALIPEASIEVFKTELVTASGRAHDLYLAPSPELWMKRLLADGSGSIFQIAPAFRNGDGGSPIHNPEFRLLEWYQPGASYTDCIPFTEELIARLLASVGTRCPAEEISPPFLRMTMSEAFDRHCGIELARCRKTPELVKEGQRLGLVMPNEPTWEEAFHVIFLSLVEPNLPREKPLVLLDYPALIPTTARHKRGTPFAERWELYLRGVEIANCYSEETDPEEIRKFLTGEEERKKTSPVSHPTDSGFARAIEKGLPACAGVALGLDRLEMVFCGETSLEGVILFPISDTLRGI
jgi:lysyl-tRNA synthetase class 2